MKHCPGLIMCNHSSSRSCNVLQHKHVLMPLRTQNLGATLFGCKWIQEVTIVGCKWIQEVTIADLVPCLQVGPSKSSGAGLAPHILEEKEPGAELLLPGLGGWFQVYHFAEEVGGLVGPHVSFPDYI
jgi:hypothetical protein